MKTDKERIDYVRSILRRMADFNVDDFVWNGTETDSLSLMVCIAINLYKVLNSSEPVEQGVLDTIEGDMKTLEEYGCVECN